MKEKVIIWLQLLNYWTIETGWNDDSYVIVEVDLTLLCHFQEPISTYELSVIISQTHSIQLNEDTSYNMDDEVNGLTYTDYWMYECYNLMKTILNKNFNVCDGYKWSKKKVDIFINADSKSSMVKWNEFSRSTKQSKSEQQLSSSSKNIWSWSKRHEHRTLKKRNLHSNDVFVGFLYRSAMGTN